MERKRTNPMMLVTLIGAIVIVAILVFGTMLAAGSARKDTEKAANSVSLLYLDELAGRREQVIEDNLNDNIRIINIALDMIDDQDLSDLDHMRAYQRKMKQLFSLERFAFVDSDGLVYNADEGIQNDIDQYRFDYLEFSEPDIFIKDMQSES